MLAGPLASEAFGELPPDALKSLLIDALRWWMARHGDVDHPAEGTDDAVLGACRALVRHRYGKWLPKVDAGRHLLDVGYQAGEVIEQVIAARSGGPQPSVRQAQAFQEAVLDEILTAT